MTDEEKFERKIARAIQRIARQKNFDFCLLAAKAVIKIVDKSYPHKPGAKWKCPACGGRSGCKKVKKDIICKNCDRIVDNVDALDWGIFW